nr:hypothetical protein BaRGS_024148 [Batillaria attramentaria]
MDPKQALEQVAKGYQIVFIQAEFDYEAYEEDEMSFGEGDVMKVEEALILQLLAVSKDKDSVYIVTELMVNGTLLEYLHREEGAMVTFPNLVAIASQIADGLAYLETERILHLDVRADNILVGERQEIKVADFSDAVFLQEEDYYTICEWTTPIGSLNYHD